MASVPSNTLQTVSMVGVRESLVDEINILTKVDARFYNACKAGKKPQARKHEFLTDTLRAGTTNKHVEGSSIDATAQGEPTRVYNQCQIIADSYIISSTSDAVDLAGRASAKAYDRMKCMKGILRDTNYSFLNGVRVDHAASTAGEMRGALNWVQTNVDAPADATVAVTGVTGGTERDLDATLIKNVLQDIWTAGGSRTALTAWMNVFQQSQFDGILTSHSTNQQLVEGGKVDDYVSVYTTAFGKVVAEMDTEMDTDQVLIADMNYWKKCILEPMAEKAVGDSLLNEKYDVGWNLTLESCNELASGRIVCLTTA